MILSKVLAGMVCEEINCDLETQITGIAYDSRAVEPGNLFVAITGYKTDGHAYIAAAVKAGAVAVICERKPEEDNIPYILTKDSRKALSQTSANFFSHPAKELKMIGITGTNGKTTTTYLIKAILEASGEKVGLIGTNQNMIGDEVLPSERTTPESFELQRLLRKMADCGCTYAVMEVSSHSLVLSRVSEIEFDIALFTNITQDHLDFHETMEEYTRAKSLLFEQCKIGIINADDLACEAMLSAGDCEYITYGINSARADVMAKNIKLKAESVEFEALCFDSIGRVELHVPGIFSVYNALAAISAALMCGISLETTGKTLAGVSGVKGRAEVVPVPEDYTVMIDYAHSPDGLENILKTVKGFAEGKTTVVFGCGGDRDKTKRPQMGKIASELADFVIVTSDNPRTEEPMDIINDILPGVSKPKSIYHVEPDRREAIYYALENAKGGDVIVLAGKGHETYQEINGVKHHMDEREIVSDYFKGKKS